MRTESRDGRRYIERGHVDTRLIETDAVVVGAGVAGGCAGRGGWVARDRWGLHELLPELGVELFPAYRDGDDVYVDEAGRAHRHGGAETGLSSSSERALKEADAQPDA